MKKFKQTYVIGRYEYEATSYEEVSRWTRIKLKVEFWWLICRHKLWLFCRNLYRWFLMTMLMLAGGKL